MDLTCYRCNIPLCLLSYIIIIQNFSYFSSHFCFYYKFFVQFLRTNLESNKGLRIFSPTSTPLTPLIQNQIIKRIFIKSKYNNSVLTNYTTIRFPRMGRTWTYITGTTSEVSLNMTTQLFGFVARGGFEPPTFRLWAWIATTTSPRNISFSNTLQNYYFNFAYENIL